MLSCLRDVLEMRVDFGSSDAGVRGEDGRKKRRWQVENTISSHLQRSKDDSGIGRCRRAEMESFPVWKVGLG